MKARKQIEKVLDLSKTETEILEADTYSFTVTFTRSARDDLEIAKGSFPDLKNPEELLLQQLKKELQGAYDDTGMAGFFDIDKDSFEQPKG